MTSADGPMVEFLQRGIHYAKLTVASGQTSRDRDDARKWILEANAVIRGISEAVSVIRVIDKMHGDRQHGGDS